MTNTWPVVMYPEGEIVGKVRSGKVRGKVRHVAMNSAGGRLGTFDTFREAATEVERVARGAPVR
jgi:hypothetical protein